MKWLRSFCILGIVTSLLLWAIPNSWKKYRFIRWERDYKILFEEHNTEYGLAPGGLVLAHHVEGYKTPPSMGRTGKALDPVRSEWITAGFRSRTPWPVNSRRIIYDEWGPSQWDRPDGIKVTQVGAVFCMPYSAILLGCAGPLALDGIFRWINRNKRMRKLSATNSAPDNLD